MAEACINTSRLPIQCPVCLDTFNRPRTLPCLHTFCASCLHSHITNAGQNASFSTFLCPVCRANTRPPRPYSSKDTWSEQFPVNHWILSVIEEASSTIKENGVFCDTHPDTKINLYCTDHEVVCCAMCVATSHRKCDNVEEIVHLLDSYNSKEIQTETLEKLSQSEDILTDLDAKCALADSNIQIDKDKMVHTIETVHEEVINHMDSLKQAAIQNVEKNCKHITNDIMTRKIICNKGRQTCKQVREMLKDSDRDKTPFSLFIHIHAAKLKMKSIDLCVANHWTFTEANTLAFEVNREFTNIKNIESIGRVKDIRKAAANNSIARANASQPGSNQSGSIEESSAEAQKSPRDTAQTKLLSPITNHYTPSRISDSLTVPISRCSELQYILYSSNPLFKKHWISGLTFLHHGLLILCNQSEKSLCLTKDNNVLYADRRLTAPWDVTKHSENVILVTYPQENIVRIFEIKCNTAVMKLFRRPSIIGRPMIFQRSFTTQEACFGIITVQDRVILACEDCIKVYTMHGRCMQIVQHSHRVEPLFGRVVGLAIDRQRSILYATDEVNNCLLSFRLIENQLPHQPTVVYKDPTLRCPRGLSVGTCGEVYVCGFVSKTVHIVNSDGACNRILTTEQRPCGVSIEQRQDILTVSFYPDSERRHTDTSYDVRFYKIKRHY